MIRRLRQSGLLWPSLFLCAALPTLIALGNWQWSRMHWKQGLLRDLEQATAAAPKPLQSLVNASSTARDNDPATLRFRRVTVSGVFEHEHEMHVWSPLQSGPGWSVVTPMRLSPAMAEQVGAARLLVIRGTVPAARKLANTRATGQPDGPQTVTGRIRADRPNTWANQPNIKKNEWFTRDVERMAAHIRTAPGAVGRVLPFFVELEHQIGGRTAPEPNLKALTLSNRHFEYAMTWWGLAATLIGVFATFVWGRRREAK